MALNPYKFPIFPDKEEAFICTSIIIDLHSVSASDKNVFFSFP